MKKKLLLIALIFILLVPSSAHPGRTDSNGGHWVRTEGWGYEVGTYHYHNSGTPKSSSSTTQTQIKAQPTEDVREEENTEFDLYKRKAVEKEKEMQKEINELKKQVKSLNWIIVGVIIFFIVAMKLNAVFYKRNNK